ncbi:NADH-quinone oxidoreductase subunit NuoE [Haloactinomyces albus]|uniref:NADH-quinone oxidoreductase subunit E n=1 Tax=Haloactinomyces albus TaxID=1352928 RepID=A0AAE4CMG8_9ACTN|nr:NADH-quinone oxidoreductase subunit NuoE [Haloactinomyces albus]MDR7302396.1 NADH-quinone oxidoreductase subunit E [Haloactinomyces albus]
MTEQFDFTTTSESVTHPRVDTSVFGEDVRADAKRIIDRYPESRSALLPLLHLVQSVQGHVTTEGMEFCAEQLALSTAEVSAVATFYTMYKRKPCGQHLVSVCTNTLCAALGGDAIYRELGEHLGVGHEGTAGTPGEQGSITLEHAECLAACDLAPVLQVNYEYYDKQTPQAALELVKALQRGEKPAPSRGAPLTDFRDAERQLAGFFDGPGADESVAGSSAAPETLQGAKVAHENGWTAPAMPDDAELPPLPEKK